jgi:Rrf2 family protein
VKLSPLEEYGLRCLLRLARQEPGTSLTIPEISEAEGISPHNVAKLLRLLRQRGFVDSERGPQGGYTLSRPPAQIVVAEALAALGGRLYEPAFCDHFNGEQDEGCQHSSIDCSVRSLWMQVQRAVDQVLGHTTLEDLLPAARQGRRPAAASEPLLQIG